MGDTGAAFRPARVRTAADVYALVGAGAGPGEVGALRTIHLDGCGRVLAISSGDAPAEARQVLRDAVSLGSAAIVVAHLSDSDAPRPAEHQIAACGALVVAARSLGIRVLDYLLFGVEDFCSFRTLGLL